MKLPFSIPLPSFSMLKIGGVVALVAALAIQTLRLNDLRDWQTEVLTAVGTADDLVDKKGRMRAARPDEAVFVISWLGKLKDDVTTATAEARAADAENVLRVDREADQVNKEVLNDYQSKLAAADRTADRLRDELVRAARMRDGGSATIGDSGGRGETRLPGSAGDRAGVAEAPGTDGLSDAARYAASPLNIDERELATVQALQLDALITAVQRMQVIDTNGASAEGDTGGK